MTDKPNRYRVVRRFVKIFKVFLGLVLLVLEILKKFK
jgi:hypothetical protein